MNWKEFSKPAFVLNLTNKALPFLAVLTFIVILFAFYLAWFVAPEDYQQGQTVRILFLHAPAAWLAMLAWTIMAISAFGTLVWKHPMADIAAKSAIPIGALFCFICLVTGALWGRPMWGTYWVWDARLTSFLIFLFMFAGAMAIWYSIEDQNRAGKIAAIYALIGAINLPIIRFSVDWWNTLHQPASIIREGGPAIHSSILYPLLVCAIAFSILFFTMHLALMRTELLKRRIKRYERTRASQAING